MQRGLEDVDIVMMLRLQTERMQGTFVPSIARVFPLLRPRPRQAARRQARRADHASRADEPRRRDRQRGRRRHRPQRDPRAGRDGRGGAHGLPRRADPRPARAGRGREPAPSSVVNAPPARPRERPRRARRRCWSSDGRIAERRPGVTVGHGARRHRGDRLPRACAWRRAWSTCGCSSASPAPSTRRRSRAAARPRRPAASPAWSCLPNTEPPIDDASVVEFVARRARQVKLAKIYTYAAVDQGPAPAGSWPRSACSRPAGAVAFTDGEQAIANARVMRRALSYAARLRRADRPAPGGADARRAAAR